MSVPGHRRINVDSGRPLEPLAHYSRAVRAGPWVLQSGTTAIDRAGNVIGAGDIAAQVDAIMALAEESMAAAGGRIADVVRSRIYVTDISLAEQAGRALARHFRDIRPAATLVQVNRLARPAQLIEIELDALDGAKERAVRISSGRPTEEIYAYSRAVRMDDQVLIAGCTALGADGQVGHPGDMHGQTRAALAAIEAAADAAGATLADLVYTKTYVTDMRRAGEQTRAKLEVLGAVRPTGTLLGIPGLVAPQMLVEIEAEAVVGAAGRRRDIYTEHRREHARGFARAVAVGDQIFVSGCTAMDPGGNMRAAGDWAAQCDLCHEGIRDALTQAGATLDDVIRRRTFTVDHAEVNRPYGEGPAWFEASRPASLGCRIASLAHPDMLVEVDAVALRGAHRDIEWRSLGRR